MTKITDLAALSGVATTDLITAVDVSDTSMAASGTNKKVPFSELITFLGANGLATTTYVDESASGGIGTVNAFTFNTATTAPPTGNQVRFNNATQASTTLIWISQTTFDGLDISIGLSRLNANWQLYMQDFDDSSQWILFTVTAGGTDLGSYWSIPVTYVNGPGLPAQKIAIQSISPANHGIPAGGADGDVLTKTSSSDYAVAWEVPPGEGSPPTGTKMTDLTAQTGAGLATTDIMETVDLSDTTMAASGTNKKLTMSDLKTFLGLPAAIYNASVASQGAGFATDTYLTGSSIAIPAGRLQAKTLYRCVFNVVRTNGTGTATPAINIRFGTAGTTSDTSRGTLTWSAQTGVADEGMFEIWAVFRTVGSGTSAVLQTLGRLTHRLSITGLGVGVSEPEIATSGGFDSTVASSIIGLSLNGGTSATWTVSLVDTELVNMA